ncbi:serine racemase [Lasiosphaeria miniovina]|uniref:Serine racemase n=1 Tax=Lasiosphaeria miniovina TaxID=1954250 RepID=A0AA40EAL5_9PEZI|nr:serine racemase [Lasiosphaeria miniovina]KAK0728448.1 serine racemase [Lasiosphaeria miniovina]
MSDPSTAPPLTRASVEAAHRLIAGHVHETPVVTSSTLSRLASTQRTPQDLAGTPWAGRAPAAPVLRLYFKCENLQRVGAFKARGAFHALERLKLDPAWDPARGVVTHSSGNHAQALALAARSNGIPAHIVMPSISAPAKIAATAGYGANIIFSGSTSVEREAVTARVVAETGARLVPPYDHPDIILGQGTAGLELLSQATSLIPSPHKTLNAIITPLGGGGLLSGVALACSTTSTHVFGAEPSYEGADDGRRGYYASPFPSRVEAVSSLTVADGLRTPVGRIPFSVITGPRPGAAAVDTEAAQASKEQVGHGGAGQGANPFGRMVAGIYNVSEDEIGAALRLVYERMKLVVEPSAVVGLAVALYNEDFRAMVEREAGADGWDLGLIFSGGNVNLDSLGRLFGKTQQASGT